MPHSQGFQVRPRPRRRRGRTVALAALATAAAVVAVTAALSQPHRPRPTAVARRPSPPRAPRHGPPARKPQFVTISFDGSGTADLWRYWRGVGRKTGARFTFFLSGVYLLGEERRTAYLPPEHLPGASDIGFTQRRGSESSRRRVRDLLRQLAAGYREGHEIGTHFNGHFCSPYRRSVAEWSATDWRQEIAQFDELVARANALNRLRPAVALGFGPEAIVGARTPCLQGNLAVLDAVLAERGFRYDASTSAPLGTRPRRHEGVWELPLPEIPLVGHSFRVIAMDYNLMANQVGDADWTDTAAVERKSLASFLNAFSRSYYGARAPFAIGYHFERWNGGAYVRALTRFLRVCRLRDVRCVPYRDVVGWLDAHRRRRAATASR